MKIIININTTNISIESKDSYGYKTTSKFDGEYNIVEIIRKVHNINMDSVESCDIVIASSSTIEYKIAEMLIDVFKEFKPNIKLRAYDKDTNVTQILRVQYELKHDKFDFTEPMKFGF